jgi:predicted choloylglycine hydrolase
MVRVSETDLFGQYLYKVFVDEETYDWFFASKPLTWSQMKDVESYYEEGLTDYVPGGIPGTTSG